jgi:OHCU decarboxylase
MTPQLATWNALPRGDAEAEIVACCGSQRWASEMAARRPFSDFARLCDAADEIWWALERADWLEAFAAHPRIGERATSGSESARNWAAQEQAEPDAASEDIASRLAKSNRAYQLRFGFIFIVDASGKSRGEMLALLEQRIQNNPQLELREAAEQQRRITRRRLEKLFSGGGNETKST